MNTVMTLGVIALLGLVVFGEGQYLYQRLRRQDEQLDEQDELIDELLTRVKVLEGVPDEH